MNRSVTFGVSRPDPNARPDVSAMRHWIVALCAIRFDLQQGQVVEECYPAGALSPEEELDVAFSAFPDSMSQANTRASVHDCVFFFRIRRRGLVPTCTNPSLGVRRTTSIPVPDRHADGPLEVLATGAGQSMKEDGPAQHPKSSQQLVPQCTLSEGSVVLASNFNGGNSPPDRESGGMGIWAGLPIPSLLASVLSPRLKPRESTTTPAMLDPPSSRPTCDEASAPPQCLSLERLKGGNSYGGPGSGGPRYLYGFVFNRQRQDERLRRGGEQKSVVILSERPYSSVFRPLVQIAGPLYFDIGARALEQVAACVSQWPPPVHGQLMELLVGSTSLRAHLPPAHTLPPGCGTPMDDFTSAMAPAPLLNQSIPQGVFHEADLFGVFRGVLMQLWVLWELLLVGEPLLVIAPTPSQCSEAVACLVGLVAPLPCSVDFRPYFTIHDPDFGGLNSLKDGEKGPPMVLGVTNLFFLKAFRRLPHVISVGTSLSAPNRLKLATRPHSQYGNRQLSLQFQLSPLKHFSPTNLLKVARVHKDGPLSLMSDHREALWTTYVAATKPDTSVLNRLVDAGMSPRAEESMSMVNNEVLRRHFVELTTNFLAPFGPYLRATTPQEGASPFRDPPALPPFNAHEFVEGLAARGPGKFLSKRLRANWLELYRRFLEGPNFMPWFQRRRAVVEQEQHRIWRQARSKTDVRSFLDSKSEVEIVDSFSAVEQHLLAELQMLKRAGFALADAPTAQKLRSDLLVIFNLVPQDVQQMLLANPQRAALLHGSGDSLKVAGRRSPEQKGNSLGASLNPATSESPGPKGSPLGFLRRMSSSPGQRGSPRSGLALSGDSSRSQELLQDPLDLNRT